MQRGAMHLAQAGRRRGLLAEAGELALPVGPNSPAMRRRTKLQPIGGALACNCASSSAYSSGSASGMVDSNCATFISGPFSPPRIALRSSAWADWLVLMPNTRWPASRAAMPPTAPEVRAMRRTSPNRLDRSSVTMSQASNSSMKPADHVQAAPPERRVGGVQPERRQQLAVPLGAARPQHVQVLGLEPGMPVLEHAVQRVHQAVAEGVGVHVERRVHEVRHVGPEHIVVRRELEGRAEALGLHLPPDCADPLGSSSPMTAARHAAGSRTGRTRSGAPRCSACPPPCEASMMRRRAGSVSASSRARKVSISPNTLAVSASVSGVPDCR